MKVKVLDNLSCDGATYAPGTPEKPTIAEIRDELVPGLVKAGVVEATKEKGDAKK